jgi:hypothetical protein
MQNLVAQLNVLTKDLYFVSETDAAWQIQPLAVDEPLIEQLYTLSGKPTDSNIEERAWADFLTNAATVQDWMGDDEKATALRYQALRDYVNTNLTEVTVFRIGSIDITIYIVGKTATGELVTLSTNTVET